MGRKKFQDRTGYNPIASQLAADVASPVAAPVRAEPAEPVEAPVGDGGQALEREKPQRERTQPSAASVATLPAQRTEPRPRPRVVAPAPAPTPKAPAAIPENEVAKKIRMSEQAWLDLDDLFRDIRAETGTQVPLSIATRACYGLMVQARAELIAAMRENPLGRLPSTKDPVAFAEFEERFRQVLAAAYRKLPRTL